MFWKPYIVVAIVLFLSISLFPVPLQAQTPLTTPTLTIEPADIATGHAFGTKVEAAGSLLLVSAPGDTSGAGTGALHVFERDAASFTWQRALKIVPQEPDEVLGAFSTDGTSIAYVIQPSTLLPGPSVKVWRKNGKGTWWQTASLDAFGGVQLRGLAVDGDDLVVVSSSAGKSNQACCRASKSTVCGSRW